MRIDIRNIEYGGNKEELNYCYKTERIKKDYNKDSKLSANIRSNHETLIPINDSIKCTKSNNKQQSNTFGKSKFYRSSSNERNEDYPSNKNLMKTENVQIKAPLATIESLSDTMVLTKKDELGDRMKGSGLHLCCICRSEDESLAQDPRNSNSEQQVYCDSPADAIVSASNTASVITTQYVCHDTQMENQEEKKRSTLKNLFEKAQNKKHGRDKKINSDTSKADEFRNMKDGDNNQRNKKSKNILRRLAKREPENTSLLKPPTAKYGNKQHLVPEPSDVSNLTALSMDNVEIIETEYPIYTEFPDSSNDGEVSEKLVLILFNVS